MNSQTIVVLLVAAVAMTMAQPPECALPADNANVCQCALRVQRAEVNPLEPIYCEANQPPVNCALGDDDINCHYQCATLYRSFVDDSISWLDPKPDDPQNRTWGQYMCDESRAAIGMPPTEEQCTEFNLEAAYRLTYCSNNNWILAADSPPKAYCCNQLGNYVPNCPPGQTVMKRAAPLFNGDL